MLLDPLIGKPAPNGAGVGKVLGAVAAVAANRLLPDPLIGKLALNSAGVGTVLGAAAVSANRLLLDPLTEKLDTASAVVGAPNRLKEGADALVPKSLLNAPPFNNAVDGCDVVVVVV